MTHYQLAAYTGIVVGEWDDHNIPSHLFDERTYPNKNPTVPWQLVIDGGDPVSIGPNMGHAVGTDVALYLLDAGKQSA